MQHCEQNLTPNWSMAMLIPSFVGWLRRASTTARRAQHSTPACKSHPCIHQPIETAEQRTEQRATPHMMRQLSKCSRYYIVCVGILCSASMQLALKTLRGRRLNMHRGKHVRDTHTRHGMNPNTTSSTYTRPTHHTLLMCCPIISTISLIELAPVTLCTTVRDISKKLHIDVCNRCIC
jgi:hypothetical protein